MPHHFSLLLASPTSISTVHSIIHAFDAEARFNNAKANGLMLNVEDSPEHRWARYSKQQFSLGGDCAGSGPVGVAHALGVHLEEADRVLAGHDAIANFVPRTILNDGGVVHRHRPGGDIPCVAIGCERQYEIADVTHRMRVQRVNLC